MTYQLGDVVRLSGTFKDAGGTLANPSTATLKLVDPAGVETTPALTNDGVGLYHADVTPAISGFYTYRFVGTGNVTAGSPDGTFLVAFTKVP